MAKTFNIVITERKEVQLSITLCHPFPVGSPSASARPSFALTTYFYDFDPTTTVLLTGDINLLHEYIQGSALRYMTFDETTKTWSSSFAPTVTLPTTFDPASGVIVVTFPFGTTYATPPFREWQPGASPMRYRYSVNLAGQTVVGGNVEMAVRRDVPVVIADYEAAACNISLSPAPPDDPWMGS